MMKKLGLLLATGLIAAAGAAYAASFTEIDANGDGAISPEEFAAAYPNATKDVWTAADANADGKLSKDELAAAEKAGMLPKQ